MGICLLTTTIWFLYQSSPVGGNFRAIIHEAMTQAVYMYVVMFFLLAFLVILKEKIEKEFNLIKKGEIKWILI